MSDPRFTQPWHGVPREQISWAPTIEPELCNGCGLCVTSCGRAVFRYDYENRMAVVAEPVQCMVGCVTCANTCPSACVWTTGCWTGGMKVRGQSLPGVHPSATAASGAVTPSPQTGCACAS